MVYIHVHILLFDYMVTEIFISTQWKVIGDSEMFGSLQRQNFKGKHAISGGVVV